LWTNIPSLTFIVSALLICLTASEPLFSEDEPPFKMQARQKRIDLKDHCVILYDSVTVERSKLRFLADAAVLFTDDKGDIKTLYAQGAVFVTDGTVTIEADSVFYDFILKKGVMLSARLRLKSEAFKKKDETIALKGNLPEGVKEIFLSAKRIVAESDFSLFTAEDGIITTCDHDAPHWGLRSKRIELLRNGTFRADGNSFFVGPITIPCPPLYIEEEWWMPIRRLYFGSRTNFGSIFSTNIRILQTKTLYTDIRYDHYSLRGDGTGIETRYRAKSYPSILLSYFYIHDEFEKLAPEDRNRWRVAFDSNWHLPDKDLLFAFRYRQTSDSAMLGDYFERICRESEPQETYALLRYWRDNYLLELLTLAKTEPFVTETEYLPSFKTELFNLTIAKPLTLDANFRLEYIRHNYAETIGLPDDECRRFFTSAKLSAPLNTAFFRIYPFLESSSTSYSRLAYCNEEITRNESSMGVSLSTLVWRRYDTALHIIEPSISFFNRFALTLEPDSLTFYDNIEQLDRERYIELAILNILNVETTRRLDVRTAYRLDLADEQNRLYLEGTVLPFKWLTLFSRFDFIGEKLPLSSRRIRATINYSGWNTYLEDYFLPNMRHLLTFKISASNEKRWAPSFLYQYDLIKNEYSKISFSLTRRLHCWIIEFGYEYDNVNKERRFVFWVSPFEFYPSRKTELTTVRMKTED